MLTSFRVMKYGTNFVKRNETRVLFRFLYSNDATNPYNYPFDKSNVIDTPISVSSRNDTERKENSQTVKFTSLSEFEQRLNQLSWDIDALVLKSKQEAEISVVEQYFLNKRLNSNIKKGEIVADSKTIGEYNFLFGTPDPDQAILEEIPCGGCGSVLHCYDPGLPGYLPSEKYKSSTREELKSLTCSRCTLMEKYKVMLEVKASDKEFFNIIKRIRREMALILVVLDLTDIQNSIIKNLFHYIGNKHHLYIIGNKVDMIPNDGSHYLKSIFKSVRHTCEKNGLNPAGYNIRHIALVSGKTGYGIEDLVTKLMAEWKGNVYMVGNTNCGKSTLFNAMLQSDYCKSSVRDVIQNATVSLWPGTTINLLKFPIMNASAVKIHKRRQRLQVDRNEWKEEMKLEISRAKEKDTLKEAIKTATLKGHIGITDFWDKEGKRQEKQYVGHDLAGFSYHGGITEGHHGIQYIQKERQKIEFDEKTFANPKFLFDTPGVIDERQIINILTQEELMAILSTDLIIPQVFLLKPDYVMYITGLTRLDYVKGNQDIFVVVYGKSDLPVHVVPKQEADDFYQEHVGSAKLGVPLGDSDRLMKLPSLIGKEFYIQSELQNVAVADIQLSSLGWVSIMPASRRELYVRLRAYTTGGQGMYFRQPAILPNAHVFHDKRKGASFAYKPKRPKPIL